MWWRQSSPQQGGRVRGRGHMAALEPTPAGRQGPGPHDTWRRQSPPQQGGRVRCRRTCGSAGAHPNREAATRAARHVSAPESTLVGRQPLGPQDTCQHAVARPALHFGFMLVREGTQSAGYRQSPKCSWLGSLARCSLQQARCIHVM
jgi:hypothetical protein